MTQQPQQGQGVPQPAQAAPNPYYKKHPALVAAENKQLAILQQQQAITDQRNMEEEQQRRLQENMMAQEEHNIQMQGMMGPPQMAPSPLGVQGLGTI